MGEGAISHGREHNSAGPHVDAALSRMASLNKRSNGSAWHAVATEAGSALPPSMSRKRITVMTVSMLLGCASDPGPRIYKLSANARTMRTSEDAMTTAACGLTIVQLPIMLTLVSYYRDPLFSMYTTNLRNITTREMDIEVEDFSASALYVLASAVTAAFGLASRKAELASDAYYTVETLEELPMWDLAFWAAVAMQHVCVVTFMCSPLDWYFLALVVTGATLMLMLLSRQPLAPGGRSRENVLMLLLALLALMLYSTVRRHNHGAFFAGLMVMDSLVLVGHTFDAQPTMQVIGNCRLCYASGMSTMILGSYLL